MPLFSWMRRSDDSKAPTQAEATSLVTSRLAPSHGPIKDLQWHVGQRQQLACELEQQHSLAHSNPGVHWFQRYPQLWTLIPPSELYQLELLCAQVPPIYAASVLSRFREVLATTNIRPWELASVFQQVLSDYANQRLHEEDDFSSPHTHLQPVEAWSSPYTLKDGLVTTTIPTCEGCAREEIPTISGYVDRLMRHSNVFTVNSDWDLQYYYHQASFKPSGAYSTTL